VKKSITEVRISYLDIVKHQTFIFYDNVNV